MSGPHAMVNAGAVAKSTLQHPCVHNGPVSGQIPDFATTRHCADVTLCRRREQVPDGRQGCELPVAPVQQTAQLGEEQLFSRLWQLWTA
jgi:hypothetical protein